MHARQPEGRAASISKDGEAELAGQQAVEVGVRPTVHGYMKLAELVAHTGERAYGTIRR